MTAGRTDGGHQWWYERRHLPRMATRCRTWHLSRIAYRSRTASTGRMAVVRCCLTCRRCEGTGVAGRASRTARRPGAVARSTGPLVCACNGIGSQPCRRPSSTPLSHPRWRLHARSTDRFVTAGKGSEPRHDPERRMLVRSAVSPAMRWSRRLDGPAFCAGIGAGMVSFEEPRQATSGLVQEADGFPKPSGHRRCAAQLPRHQALGVERTGKPGASGHRPKPWPPGGAPPAGPLQAGQASRLQRQHGNECTPKRRSRASPTTGGPSREWRTA